MSLRTLVVALLLALCATAPAEARRSPITAAAQRSLANDSDWSFFGQPEARAERSGRRATASHRRTQATHSATREVASHSGVGSRPGAWCGWYMRTRHGGGPEMNLAWNWSRYGSSTSPQVGAIVVWRHHVGEIVGQAANGQWIVLSGNDGHAVRQRPRSIAGAVVRI